MTDDYKEGDNKFTGKIRKVTVGREGDGSGRENGGEQRRRRRFQDGGSGEVITVPSDK